MKGPRRSWYKKIMARTIYPGLTKTENARRAKHTYVLETGAEERVCIVHYTEWMVPLEARLPGGAVDKRFDYYIHHIKDAHTGQELEVDTRKGGWVKRRAPVQVSWIH